MQFRIVTEQRAMNSALLMLRNALRSNNKVLWLVSGGSWIPYEVAMMQSLAAEERSKLMVLLADERYVTAGHADSNYHQLQEAGFSDKRVDFVDVLATGESLEETTSHYAEVLQHALTDADFVFATLGIGYDGHTAGILPASPAATDNTSLVIGYRGHDFLRMTSGLHALANVNTAVVFAYGQKKHEALMRLADKSESVSNVPSMLLYDLPDVTIYNDFIDKEVTK